MAERRPVLDGSPAFWMFLKYVLLGPALRLLFRPKVTGLEHVPREGGAILAANHVSFLDPLLLPLVVPRRVMFLTKVKYIDKPMLRWFLTGAGVIPVATDDPSAVGGAVTAGVEAVRAGRLVGIFPEGTRSRDGLLHRGKTGVARIAMETGVPVIPAGITGTDLAFPRGAKLPRPHSVHITFGPPITLAWPEGKHDPSRGRIATDQVMAAIGALSGQETGEDYSPAE
ncbi:MAG TPA: lysophospholipid acyltransferase family protein [Streptosporangiaceae bacterium]|nr:lysophospholipid acyltransferase family protein [Streptosporangiaceae bacterium]